MMKAETKKATGKPVAKGVQTPPRDRAVKSPSPRAGLRVVVRLIAVLLALSSIPASAATTVWGSLVDIGYAAYETKLTWTPTNLVLISQGGLQVGPPKTITATNGFFTNSWDCGDYWVKTPLVPTRSAFLVSVPCTGGPYHITNLLGAGLSHVYSNTAALHIAAGSGVTVTTNNNLRTIASTGGGSSTGGLINADDGWVYQIVGVTVNGVMSAHLAQLYQGTNMPTVISADDGETYALSGVTVNGVVTLTLTQQ